MPEKRKNITHFRLNPADPPQLTAEEKARLEALPIDYSDIPELPDDFWSQHPPAVREKKRLVTLRLDADVLRFFRARGSGYQREMNAVLRSYMEAQSREPFRPRAQPREASDGSSGPGVPGVTRQGKLSMQRRRESEAQAPKET